jgi:hypothetical protein
MEAMEGSKTASFGTLHGMAQQLCSVVEGKHPPNTFDFEQIHQQKFQDGVIARCKASELQTLGEIPG